MNVVYRCETTKTQKRAFNSSELRNGTDLGAARFPAKSRAFWGGRILPSHHTFMTHWAFVLLKVNGESVVPDPDPYSANTESREDWDSLYRYTAAAAVV